VPAKGLNKTLASDVGPYDFSYRLDHKYQAMKPFSINQSINQSINEFNSDHTDP